METIVDLERIAAAHWRGTEEEWLGGWLLRAAGGHRYHYLVAPA
jgi:hypothetical protein